MDIFFLKIIPSCDFTGKRWQDTHLMQNLWTVYVESDGWEHTLCCMHTDVQYIL